MANDAMVENYLRSTPAYDSMSDADVASALSVTVVQPIPFNQFVSLIQGLSSYNAIVAATTDPGATSQVKTASQGLADWIVNWDNGDFPNIDTTNSRLTGFINTLVGANIMSSADAASITAAATVYPCQGPVVTAEVTNARAQWTTDIASAVTQVSG